MEVRAALFCLMYWLHLQASTATDLPSPMEVVISSRRYGDEYWTLIQGNMVYSKNRLRFTGDADARSMGANTTRRGRYRRSLSDGQCTGNEVGAVDFDHIPKIERKKLVPFNPKTKGYTLTPGKSSSYKIYPEGVLTDFSSMQRFCGSLKADPLVVESIQEAAVIKSMLPRFGVKQGYVYGGYMTLIGKSSITTIFGTEVKEWLWGEGEPQQFSGKKCGCLDMNVKLHTCDCDHCYAFICEKRARN